MRDMSSVKMDKIIVSPEGVLITPAMSAYGTSIYHIIVKLNHLMTRF